MNEPIINPMIFYCIEVISRLCFLPGFVLIGGLVVSLARLCILGCTDSDEPVFTETSFYSWLVVFVVSSVIAFFVPSEETMYKMLVAQYVTENNIECGAATAERAIEIIAEKVMQAVEASGK